MDEIELLKKLVAIPSITPHNLPSGGPELTGESRIADYLVKWGKSVGLEAKRIEPFPGRPSLIFEIPASGGDPNLPVLAAFAHMDTVYVPGMDDPFTLKKRADGSCGGLGACDNKGSIVSVLSALLSVKSAGGSPTCRFSAVLTAGEEGEMRGVQDVFRAGFQANAAIVCEATGLNVITAHKGSLRWKIRTTGKAVHSSLVPAGDNAIYHAAKLLLVIEKKAKEYTAELRHPLLKYPTLSAGVIRGGAQPNSVPDFCEILVDRRLLPGETPESAAADLRSALEETGETFTMEQIFFSPPFELPKEEKWFSEQVLNESQTICSDAKSSVLYCATEAGRTQTFEHVPSLVFGPGDIAKAHSVHDSIKEKDLKDAARILFNVAMHFHLG